MLAMGIHFALICGKIIWCPDLKLAKWSNSMRTGIPAFTVTVCFCSSTTIGAVEPSVEPIGGLLILHDRARDDRARERALKADAVGSLVPASWRADICINTCALCE